MNALEEAVRRALGAVYDPCSVAAGAAIGVVDMGLVTRLEIDSLGRVEIDLRATSPMCTLAGSIVQAVEAQVTEVPGVSAVTVTVDWSKSWSEAELSPAGASTLAERRRRSRAEVPVEPQEWKRRLARSHA